MAYSDLSSAEMVEISHLWVGETTVLPNGETAPTYRKEISEDAVLGGIIEKLEEVHNPLLHFVKKEEEESSSTPALPLKELVKRQRGYDKRHDELIRGLDEFLRGLAALVRNPDLKKKILALLAHLLPAGRKTANFTYTEEAGAARQLESRLTADDKQLLKTIVVKFSDLLDADVLEFVTELIGLGKQIGALEEKKQELRRDASGTPQNEPSEKKLKGDWVNRVTTFERMVYLSNLSKEDQEAILAPLYRLEERAAERAREELARQQEAEKKAQEQKEQAQEKDKLLPPGSTPENS